MLASFAQLFAPMLMGAPFEGVLDRVPGAAAAYSVARQLRFSYGGPLLRLRRASDNAESDFGALPNGNLDTIAIDAFIAATTGHVTTLYDQTGGGVHLTQVTAGKQPVYTVVNGVPWMRFTAASSQHLTVADNAAWSIGDVFATGAVKARFVTIPPSGKFRGLFGKYLETGNQREWVLYYIGSSARFNFFVSATGGATTPSVNASGFGAPVVNTDYTLIWAHDPTANTIGLSVNAGIENTTAHSGGIFNGTTRFSLGSPDAAEGEVGFWNDYMGGAIIWKRALTLAEKELLYMDWGGQEDAYLFPTWTTAISHDLFLLKSTAGKAFDYYYQDPVYTDAVEIVRDAWLYDDGTTYWAVVGNTDGVTLVTTLILISSTNLVTWSLVTHIDFAGIASTQQVYAGKWFVDPADGSVHVVVPLSPNADGTGFQIYETRPTNGAMTTWSAAVLVTGTSLPANMIDPFIVKKAGTYYLWFKNETTKHIVLASSSSPFSGYTMLQTGDWAGWGSESEAPTLIQFGSTWRLYMDKYAGIRMAWSESTDDWATWSAPVAVTGPISPLGGGGVFRTTR